MISRISGSPGRPPTLPQALFFSRKMAPIFLEALDEPLRCRRRFFFPEKWSLDFGGDSQMDLDLDISSL